MVRSFSSCFIYPWRRAAAATVLGAAFLAAGCAAPLPVQPARVYPGPASYLEGKNIEAVARVYGNPGKSSTVGSTTFVSYTGSGRSGSRYSNICFLQIQSDRDSGVIRQVEIGSNLGIDSQRFGFDPRQDCNRIFYREALAR